MTVFIQKIENALEIEKFCKSAVCVAMQVGDYKIGKSIKYMRTLIERKRLFFRRFLTSMAP
jgi:hypothetical protein